MSKPLSIQLIRNKTKTDNIHLIKNLNLWGNDIDDVSILKQMPNLQVVSLSVNKINSLKQFSSCKQLKELYLRKNHIKDIDQVKHLKNLHNLKILWLSDNPCSNHPKYREIVIRNLPNLMKLDNDNITGEQKQNAGKRNCQIFQSVPMNQKPKWSKKQHNVKKQQFYKQEIKKNLTDQEEVKDYYLKKQNNTRNQNLLNCIRMLFRELDRQKLIIVKKEIDNMLSNR